MPPYSTMSLVRFRRPGLLAGLAQGTNFAYQNRDVIQNAANIMAKYIKKRKASSARTRPYSNKKRKTSNSKGPSSGPITAQRDFATSFSRSKPSRGGRKWKSFVRKVKKATEDNDKTHFLVEANSVAVTVTGTVALDVQEVVGSTYTAVKNNFQLSAVGNIATGPGKMADNLIYQPSVDTVAAGTTNVTAPIKAIDYNLLGACMTLSFKTQVVNPMYVDIYECVAASHITDTNFASAYLAWVACALQSEVDLSLAHTKLTASFTGSTPYQAPGFGKYWKILKKTRVLCGPGTKTNYTFFTGKRHVQNAKELNRYATKGLTKDLIIVANPTYHGDVGAITQLTIEWSKNYNLKLHDVSGTQTQWAYQATYA